MASETQPDVTPQTTGRWHVSVQGYFLSYHPGGGTQPELYPRKIDQDAYFVVTPGIAFNLDYDFTARFFTRYGMGYYRDSADVHAGYLHAALHFVFYQKGDHLFHAGIGPSLLVREDWHQFEAYNGDAFYGDRVYRGWQYRFILYGGECEYLYRIDRKTDFQFSVIPGIPIIVTCKIGIRYLL